MEAREGLVTSKRQSSSRTTFLASGNRGLEVRDQRQRSDAGRTQCISESGSPVSSVAQSCPTLVTPWTAAHKASLSITNSRSLLKLMSIESMMPSPPLSSPSPPAFNLSRPKYWSFSFSISPSHEYSGMISFRMDWLDLLAVQWTLKSFLQHHSSKL